jgi:hypothetical protein
MESSDMTLKNDGTKKTHQKKQRSSSRVNERILEYQPEKDFSIGQTIYHPKFEEKGKVVRKSKSVSGNFKKITVRFKRAGEKILVSAYQKRENGLLNGSSG